MTDDPVPAIAADLFEPALCDGFADALLPGAAP